MAKAYISAGSNLGNRKENLEFALASLADNCSIRRVSSYFETEPVGYLEQPWFLNIVIEIETSLSPLELLRQCQSIESSGGRVRIFANAPRTLDLDILFYDSLAIDEQDLVIPHPRIQERKFVLVPLTEIASDFVHPVLGRPIRALLQDCPDTSVIRLFE